MISPTISNALVCGKWTLPILPGNPNKLASGAKGYYEYINERPKETGKNALCIEWLLSKLPNLMYGSVIENFGGVGVFSTIIENMLQPTWHWIFDIDSDCVAQLGNAFKDNENVSILSGDARYELGADRADLYVQDFPFMTIKRFPEWENQIGGMFHKMPQAVIWMDGASRYLHFHKERYAEIFGSKVENIEDYTYGVSKFINERYGYSITHMAGQHACSYFLFQRTEDSLQHKIQFQHVTDGTAGLHIQ